MSLNFRTLSILLFVVFFQQLSQACLSVDGGLCIDINDFVQVSFDSHKCVGVISKVEYNYPNLVPIYFNFLSCGTTQLPAGSRCYAKYQTSGTSYCRIKKLIRLNSAGETTDRKIRRGDFVEFLNPTGKNGFVVGLVHEIYEGDLLKVIQADPEGVLQKESTGSEFRFHLVFLRDVTRVQKTPYFKISIPFSQVTPDRGDQGTDDSSNLDPQENSGKPGVNATPGQKTPKDLYDE